MLLIYCKNTEVLAQEKTMTKAVLTERVAETTLITIRDPEELRKHGWKAPYPSYVIAAPSLWRLWLELTARGK